MKPEPFYCSYGDHELLPLKFENDPANKGICLDCALLINDLIRLHVFVPAVTARNAMKQRLQWENEKGTRSDTVRMRAGQNAPGWVYYVEQGNLIKIGYASNVPSRVKSYGPTAQLLAVHPGTMTLEKQMHAKFTTDLAFGREWFTKTDSLMDHIAQIVARFGDAAKFAPEFTIPKSREDRVRASVEPVTHYGYARASRGA